MVAVLPGDLLKLPLGDVLADLFVPVLSSPACTPVWAPGGSPDGAPGGSPDGAHGSPPYPASCGTSARPRS